MRKMSSSAHLKRTTSTEAPQAFLTSTTCLRMGALCTYSHKECPMAATRRTSSAATGSSLPSASSKTSVGMLTLRMSSAQLQSSHMVTNSSRTTAEHFTREVLAGTALAACSDMNTEPTSSSTDTSTHPTCTPTKASTA